MSNRNELRNARREESDAIARRKAIEALPRRVGSVVHWDNGVVWTRAGDDDWRPDASPDLRYPSAHVAGWIGH